MREMKATTALQTHSDSSLFVNKKHKVLRAYVDIRLSAFIVRDGL